MIGPGSTAAVDFIGETELVKERLETLVYIYLDTLGRAVLEGLCDVHGLRSLGVFFVLFSKVCRAFCCNGF